MASVAAAAKEEKKTASAPPSNNDGVGKGTLNLPDSVKRELYNEPSSCASKKRKTNDNSNSNEEWVNVGRLGFYLEIPRGMSKTNLIKKLKQHTNKMLSVTPLDDSRNPSAIQVGIPGRRYDTIWKYGGDIYLTRFLMGAGYSRRTKCQASLPDNIEILDDPKRKKTFWLIPIDIHFFLHKEIDLFDHPDKNVKRQIKQLINYMRGGTLPYPAIYTWPIVREEIAMECMENASVLDRLMKKKTAKDWWKGD